MTFDNVYQIISTLESTRPDEDRFVASPSFDRGGVADVIDDHTGVVYTVFKTSKGWRVVPDTINAGGAWAWPDLASLANEIWTEIDSAVSLPVALAGSLND